MKKHKLLPLILLILIQLSCTKNNEPELIPIEYIKIQTDKQMYHQDEMIAYRIINKTFDEITFFACQYQSDPALKLQKYDGGEWIDLIYTVCPEFTRIPVQNNQVHSDTLIPFFFAGGNYRVGVLFRWDQHDTLIYSNNFGIVFNKYQQQ
ncbi:MAG: hypothetical protein KDC05_10095 [Bacteroidales bacterium]|nr:hypothetical protein [Bacteroidales bacterium]